MGTRQDLAVSIHRDGCVWFAGPGDELRTLRKHKEFPHAPKSPFFVSLRTPGVKTHGGNGTLTEESVNEIGLQMWEEYKTRGLTARLIAPIPNAAIPYGEAMVRAAATDPERPTGLVIVEMTKEGEGQTGSITSVVPGDWQEGEEVVPIDDLITGAGTKKDAIILLREAGLIVETLMVVIDREQGGAAELEKLGVTLVALLLFSSIVDMLTESGAISGYQRGRYDQYVADDHDFNLEHELV